MQSSQVRKVDLPSTSDSRVRNKDHPSWANDLNIFPLDFFTTNRSHIIKSTKAFVRELSQWTRFKSSQDLGKLKSVLRRLMMFLHAFATYIDSKMQLEPEMEEQVISLVSLYMNFELRFVYLLKRESTKGSSTHSNILAGIAADAASTAHVFASVPALNNCNNELVLNDVGAIDIQTVDRYRQLLINRFSHWLYILLPSHEQRVDALLSTSFYYRSTRPVLEPIFRKILSEMPHGPFSSVSYVRHMLAFKTWREQCLVVEDEESRVLCTYIERHLRPLDFKAIPEPLLRCLGNGTNYWEHVRPYTVILKDECKKFIRFCRQLPAAADHINLESISEGISFLDDDVLYDEENEISKLMNMISHRKMRRLALEQTPVEDDVIDLTETSHSRSRQPSRLIEPCDYIDLTEDDVKPPTFRKNVRSVSGFSIRTDLFSPSTSTTSSTTSSLFHEWRGRQPLELNPAPPPSPAPPTPSRVHTLAILAEKGASQQHQQQIPNTSRQQEDQSRVTNLQVDEDTQNQNQYDENDRLLDEPQQQSYKSQQLNDMEDDQAPIHRTHCPYHDEDVPGDSVSVVPGENDKTCNNTQDDRKPVQFCDNASSVSGDLNNRTCTTENSDNCAQTNDECLVQINDCGPQTNDGDGDGDSGARLSQLVISDVTSIANDATVSTLTTTTATTTTITTSNENEEVVNCEHTPETLDKRKSIDETIQESNDEILRLCNELETETEQPENVCEDTIHEQVQEEILSESVEEVPIATEVEVGTIQEETPSIPSNFEKEPSIPCNLEEETSISCDLQEEPLIPSAVEEVPLIPPNLEEETELIPSNLEETQLIPSSLEEETQLIPCNLEEETTITPCNLDEETPLIPSNPDEETQSVPCHIEETPLNPSIVEETPTLLDNEEETPTIPDNVEETHTIQDIVEETPTILEETPVIEDNIQETPIIEDNVEETPVIEDISEETISNNVEETPITQNIPELPTTEVISEPLIEPPKTLDISEETPIISVPEEPTEPELPKTSEIPEISKIPENKPGKKRNRRTETSLLLQNSRSNRKRKNGDKEDSPVKRKRIIRKPEETTTTEESTNKENLKTTDEIKAPVTTQRKGRRKQLELLLDCDRKDQIDLDFSQNDAPSGRKGRRKIDRNIEIPPEIEQEVVPASTTKRGRRKSTEIESPEIIETDPFIDCASTSTISRKPRRPRRTSDPINYEEVLIEKVKKTKQKTKKNDSPQDDEYQYEQIKENVIDVKDAPVVSEKIDEKPKRRRKQNIKDIVREENKLIVETSNELPTEESNKRKNKNNRVMPEIIPEIPILQKEKKTRGRPSKNKPKQLDVPQKNRLR